MTHEGQSSARVTGPCFVMGQAAGTAAAMAIDAGVRPNAVDVGALQGRTVQLVFRIRGAKLYAIQFVRHVE